MDLHYRELGEGQPLLILHGLFGMLDNWLSLGRKWSEQYRVFLIDQRNHGRSPHSEDFDYPILAEDVFDFIQEHDLPAVNLLGHSMGGKTAMHFATQYPELVERLIVVDIAPVDYPERHDMIFNAFAQDISALKSRKEAEHMFESVLPEYGVRQFILKNLHRSKEGPYVWRPNHEVLQQTYPAIIANSLSPYDQFEGPTLFIKGGRSEAHITQDSWPLISHYFPQAELKTVADAGHWVHAEQPEELSGYVLDFLQEPT